MARSLLPNAQDLARMGSGHVYDPEYRGTISAKTHLMATDYSAFEGWERHGRADVVTVRGQVMVREGKFVGSLGHGKFLRRKTG